VLMNDTNKESNYTCNSVTFEEGAKIITFKMVDPDNTKDFPQILEGVAKNEMIAPETPEDLVQEGNQIGHCVGSYVKNVCKQTSAILFLRKKKQIDKSYITIEIKDGNIVQAKCKMNALPDEEQRKVIENFAESMQLNIVGY